MARRKDHTRVQLKEMSLLAGQKILQEEGIPSFSARKIAKEIGYTVGTVYNVFDLINSAIIECGIPENEVQHYSMLFWSIVQGACLLSLTRKIDLHNIEAVNSMIEKSLTNLFKR
jgi:hypothetical protein